MYEQDTIRKHISNLANGLINDYNATVRDPAEDSWYKCDCCGEYYAPWTGDGNHYSVTYYWSKPYITAHRFGWSSHASTIVCLECNNKVQGKVEYRLNEKRVKEYKKILNQFKDKLRHVRAFR